MTYAQDSGRGVSNLGDPRHAPPPRPPPRPPSRPKSPEVDPRTRRLNHREVSDPPRPLTRDTLLDADALAPLGPPAPAPLPAPAPAENDPDTLVSRTPDAQGTFGVTPLVYALVHALDRRFTGTLTVREGSSAPAVLALDDGAVVRIDARGAGDRIGEEAVATGVCSEPQLANALAKSMRDRTRLGLELVSQADVSPEMIKHLLLIQAAKRVAQLVNLPPETSYALHLGRRLREPYEPWAPLDVVLAAVRAWGDRPRIHGTMRFIGTRPLRLHPDADLTALVTLPNERMALDAMRAGDITVETLYRSKGGGLSSLLYVLAVTRQFAFSQEKGPPMGRPFAKPLAAPYELEPSSPPAIVIAPLERPITASFAVADTTPGAVVERTTAPYPIEAGPRPSAGVPQLSSPRRASVVPAKAAPAALAATEPAIPAPPLPLPPKKKDAPPPLPSAPEQAGGAGQDDSALAEAALAKKDYKTAELHASRATHADPKRPEFAALFAWVCAHGGEENALPESVRALTRILEEHPKCEPALYFRGMLLKKAGKEKSALRDFVMILYQNPSHPQALGEVRELRKKNKP